MRHLKHRIRSTSAWSVPALTCFSLVVALVVSVTVSGCAILAASEPAAQVEPTSLEWRDDFLREHIRFFNGAESGRGTASTGSTRAAAYVDARMRQFGLQPGLHGDFRLVYQTPMNYPLSADLVVSESDTMEFQPGVDVLPDARSDSGSVAFSSVVLIPDAMPGSLAALDYARAPIAVLAASQANSTNLPRLRDLGFEGALLVGPLRAGSVTRPVDGLIVSQITRDAASVLLAGTFPVDAQDAGSDGRAPRVINLNRSVYLHVSTDFQQEAGAVNVVGFLSGKNPVRRDELIIVCADLDALATIAGAQALDLQTFGVQAAALLEVARNYELLSQISSAPERSLLFAVFSGSRLDNTGLRAYLQNPLWDLTQTSALVYVGLPGHREDEVRNLLAPLDIPLFTIAPPAAPHSDPEPLVVSVPAYAQRAGIRPGDASGRPVPSVSELVDEAVSHARTLATETNEILLPLTSGFGNGFFLPLIGSEAAQ